MAKADLTAARLREVLHYDPERGTFRRLACFQRPDVVGRDATRGGHYPRMGIDGHRYYAHHLAWLYMTGAFPVLEIDHRDGDKNNFKWGNLREVTSSENKQNWRRAKSDSSSGLLGVSWDSARNKWAARIKVGKVYKYLGRFDDKFAASAAYLAAKREHHAGCTI